MGCASVLAVCRRRSDLVPRGEGGLVRVADRAVPAPPGFCPPPFLGARTGEPAVWKPSAEGIKVVMGGAHEVGGTPFGLEARSRVVNGEVPPAGGGRR